MDQLDEEIDISTTFLDHFSCLNCHAILAEVIECENKTALYFHFSGYARMIVRRATITCQECGTDRKFFSVPMSAKRLGIVE